MADEDAAPMTSPETQEKPKFEGPTTLEGTLVVKKPLGVRIHKSTLRVTHVEANAAAQGEVFIGDKITAIDGKAIAEINELNKRLKEPTQTVAVRFEHGSYSFCRHLGTTVEMLQLDKEVVKATGRAIDVIKVCLNLKFLIEIDDQKEDILAMSVQYDARERVQVASCEPGGLAAIHLRPGDIIRDVNDRPIASKEMLQFYILEGITENNGQVRLTVERAAGGDDAYRDQIEMSADVVDIAQKQIALFRTATSKSKMKSVYRGPVAGADPAKKGNVKFTADAPTELLIQSDHDPSSLKSCKSANK
uniref:PDZ domain-containing protein n=1 Tax=Panagrellus redivivus TaxID=6233 RepID=A0A7E4VJH9_PANRE